MPVAEVVVNQAKNAIDDAKDHPGDHAGSQKIPRPAKKPKNRNGGKKDKNPGAGYVALKGKTLKKRNLIRDYEPSRKNQADAYSGIDAGVNGRIVKKSQAARARQICSNEHLKLGSQEADLKERIYEDGCGMSTATELLGALSFPARSKAVTVYQ